MKMYNVNLTSVEKLLTSLDKDTIQASTNIVNNETQRRKCRYLNTVNNMIAYQETQLDEINKEGLTL